MPRIVNWLHQTLRFKSQLARLLLIVFVTNIMVAGTGFASPANWLEHEKSHFSAVQQLADSDRADTSPEQPSGQKLVKHECHASHYFQTIVTAGPIMLPPASPLVPVIFYQAPVLRDTAESLFRPPR